jgi:hypothetical protein
MSQLTQFDTQRFSGNQRAEHAVKTVDSVGTMQRAEHVVSNDKVCTIVKAINRDSVGTRGQNMLSQMTKFVP